MCHCLCWVLDGAARGLIVDYCAVLLCVVRSSGVHVDWCSLATQSSLSRFFSSSISLVTTTRLSTARGRTWPDLSTNWLADCMRQCLLNYLRLCTVNCVEWYRVTQAAQYRCCVSNCESSLLACHC